MPVGHGVLSPSGSTGKVDVTMGVVQQLYQRKLSAGELQENRAQAAAIVALDRHANALISNRKRVRLAGIVGWFQDLLFGRRSADFGQGIYIHGPVGRGKTLVMDLFVEAMADQQPRVFRTHFHQFFAGVHRDIHKRRAQGLDTEDVMATLAAELAGRHDVLAFDEFYVNNIADAMILGRFLDALFRAGVAIIFTSNDAPTDLYPGGLQRERFVPTIDLIRNRSDVIFVDAGTDYRLLQRRLPTTFHTPLGGEADRFIDACLSDLSGDVAPAALTLYLDGARLEVPCVAGGFARFGFAELCEKPLGRGEYLVLAREFKGLLVTNVPQFSDQNRDASERFRILIDILYDQNKFLAMTAASEIEALLTTDEDERRMGRTVSRLIEMQSPSYVREALGNALV